MKCKDVQKILFAYIDGDISDQEYMSVSKHLSYCEECRSTLEGLKSTREKLVMLRETPELPVLQVSTIQEKAVRRTRFSSNKIRLSTTIALPVILILAIILPITFFDGASGVLAKAYAATEKIETYRFDGEVYTYFIDKDKSVLSVSEKEVFGGYDNYYVKIYPRGEGYYQAIIVVDGRRYIYGQVGKYQITESYFEELAPTKQKTLDYLALIDNVETLEDEFINGTECYHYKGTVSTEKWLERMIPRFKKNFENWPGISETDLDELVENFINTNRRKEIRYELWVGKNDYLVRQVKEYTKILPTGFYETIFVMNFYDFDEVMDIQPPLDKNGDLLEGWRDIEN